LPKVQEFRFAIVHGLDILRNTMLRILTKDLPLHAYKDQLTQELQSTDHLLHRTHLSIRYYKIKKCEWQFFEENPL